MLIFTMNCNSEKRSHLKHWIVIFVLMFSLHKSNQSRIIVIPEGKTVRDFIYELWIWKFNLYSSVCKSTLFQLPILLWIHLFIGLFPCISKIPLAIQKRRIKHIYIGERHHSFYVVSISLLWFRLKTFNTSSLSC